jgi:prepilin-type N-terminal cleavage/methylation domain-containing protein
MKTKNNQKGFTLIELLVVIAVIGLLASVVLVALNGARLKSRETKRLADVAQFVKALELYYGDNNAYPLSGGVAGTCGTGGTCPNSAWSNSIDSSWTTLQTAMQKYLSKLPHDPSESLSGWAGDGVAHTYAYFNGAQGNCVAGQWYMIVYNLEVSNGLDPGVLCGGVPIFQYGGAGANTSIKTVGVGHQ